MAARNCLLCGKPLSRIWAGTGEDFCSREHRNQYRLRRGMERLSEANQIATVMRRREQPKHIPPSELRAPGPNTPRAFLNPVSPRLREMAAPLVRLAGRPRMQPAGRFASPRALAGETGIAREVEAPRMTMRTPAVPRPTAHLYAHVSCAPPFAAHPVEQGLTDHRPASVEWAKRVLPLTARMPIARKRIEFPERVAKIPACRGKALRVSTAKAFRLPDSMAPAIQYTPPQTNELPRPDVKVMVKILPPAEAESRPVEIVTEPQAMRVPQPPPADFERRFRWPEALEMTLQFRNTANGHRTSAVPFGSPDETKERR
jgi:hypothetical protein